MQVINEFDNLSKEEVLQIICNMINSKYKESVDNSYTSSDIIVDLYKIEKVISFAGREPNSFITKQEYEQYKSN